jgi:hypothetical protein
MVIDESVHIIVSVIRQKRKEDERDTGIDESIIEELPKARKESSGFHLGIKTQDTTRDSRLSLEYAIYFKEKEARLFSN